VECDTRDFSTALRTLHDHENIGGQQPDNSGS
jgi:hypothetical protein